MLATLLIFILAFISAVLLCAIIYLLILKKRSSSKTNHNNKLLTGEIPNYTLLGNLFWKVFNTSNNAILLLQDYKIVNCNKKALELFDADYDYLIGKTPFELSPQYQPMGEQSDIKGKLILEEIFEKGIVNFEWTHKKRSNELFIAEISATSFETDGQYYVAVTMRDVTRKKNEQQELTNYRLQLEKLVIEKTELLEDSNTRLRELNHELDAANEELIANNEELRYTNEHLEKEIQEHQRTQEKKAIAEEKIKQFIHQSSNGIIIINNQGQIEEWNETMTSICGIDKTQAVNHFIWDINGQWSASDNKEAEIERFKKNTMNFFDNINERKIPVHSFETRVKHPTLGDKYIQIFMYPIITNHTTYAGFIIIDITQKKAIETELDKYKADLETLLAKNSERLMQLSGRFNEIYNVSSDAITFIDIEDNLALKIFDMNPAAQAVFGITPNDIKKGIYAKDLLPPEKITPFIEKVIPRMLEGETITFTDDIDTGHGYWKSTIYPIKDANGKITRIASFSKNITAEKQNEKTTALLNLALDSWPYELWVADNQGKCILQNKASISMWGNQVGIPLEDFDVPDDFKKASITDSQKALSGEIVSSEFVLDTPAGKRFVLYNLHPIRLANELNGYLGIGIDITERKLWEEKIKASEEKYRLLAENIDDVIWKMDLETRRYNYISPSMVKLSGYTAEEAIALTLDQILTPNAYKEVLTELDQRIKDFNNNDPSARNRTYEYEIRHKNGYSVWVEMNTSFITDSSEKPIEIIATSRDISERKASEIALRESEKRFFDALEFQPVPIAISVGSKILLFNKSFTSNYGYSIEDTPTVEHWIDQAIVNSEELEKVKSIWNLLLENKLTQKIREHHIRCKDGSMKWIEVTENKIGEMLISVFNNITERKAAESALRESEARYSLITKLSGYVVFDFNVVAKTTEWAGAVEEVTGYTGEELNSLPFDKIIELTHPNDRYKNEVNYENMVQEYSYKHQTRFSTKNKGYIWIETQAFIFSEDKKPTRWLGIIRDITEQRNTQELIIKSEEKFRTIFDASKDGIALLDKDLTIIDINKSLIAKTKFENQDIIGKKSADFLTAHTAEDTIKWIDNIWNAQSIENLETELKLSTTEYLPVEISAATIVINKENTILLIIRDISERKKHESELLKSVINTEERERLHFSQELHDGLGPLLSAAKMYVDWLDKPNANIHKEEIIPDIKNLLEEATQSIRNISFKLSPHILKNYGIPEALNAYSEKVKQAAKIEININAPEIPRFTEISEIVVYRVLCECINNTVKHAKAKSIHIVFAQSSHHLAVNYSDDGVGFDLPAVMNKRKGIGLLNMQSRLKSINSEFHINTTPGHGTNIFLKINTDNM